MRIKYIELIEVIELIQEADLMFYCKGIRKDPDTLGNNYQLAKEAAVIRTP